MFLAAKYMEKYIDRASALAALAQLENTSIQDIDEVDQASDMLILDVKHDIGTHVAPLLIIMLTTPEGVKLFLASGRHLSSTAAGAKMAFVEDLLPSQLEEEASPPAICCVFEFTFGGGYVLH